MPQRPLSRVFTHVPAASRCCPVPRWRRSSTLIKRMEDIHLAATIVRIVGPLLPHAACLNSASASASAMLLLVLLLPCG